MTSQEQKPVMIHKKTEAVKAIHDTKRQKEVGAINLTRVKNKTKKKKKQNFYFSQENITKITI